jgi:hypothetical protein
MMLRFDKEGDGLSNVDVPMFLQRYRSHHLYNHNDTTIHLQPLYIIQIYAGRNWACSFWL